MAGTPLYMSPEAIQTPDLVDARSDIYAVGAVGYFLITGQPVFNATSLVDLCQQHVTALPIVPSERLGKPVSSELEAALLACLEKTRAKRPQTARDLAALLDRAPTAASWKLDDAEAWWGRHERAQAPGGGTTSPPTPSPTASSTRASSSGFDQTLASGRSST
jgi:serine/threonine protein kinase